MQCWILYFLWLTSRELKTISFNIPFEKWKTLAHTLEARTLVVKSVFEMLGSSVLYWVDPMTGVWLIGDGQIVGRRKRLSFAGGRRPDDPTRRGDDAERRHCRTCCAGDGPDRSINQSERPVKGPWGQDLRHLYNEVRFG